MSRGEPRRSGKPRDERPIAIARGLNSPRPARVRLRSAQDAPAAVDGEAVQSLRESWLVEDRWWTDAPLRRRYWELVGERGRNVVVFHDLCTGRWFVQRP